MQRDGDGEGDGGTPEAATTSGETAEAAAGASGKPAAEEAGASGEPAAEEAGASGEPGVDEDGGVDTEHVMNLTFVLTLLFGVPVVVVLSLVVPLDGWGEIGTFVVQVGAAIWFLTALTLYVRERIRA